MAALREAPPTSLAKCGAAPVELRRRVARGATKEFSDSSSAVSARPNNALRYRAARRTHAATTDE